ncbi:MAG: cupin domain-containing protein [Myxococcales bacterium]|nr:cupin domain-containing protein [Polyangiaceae bacterium]MDW8250330.1 cupin domain-containing protein [Myxococcales bacterium]
MARRMQGLTLLGGLTEEEFCERYWQKKPLLVRGAIPRFTGLLTPDELAGLACEEDMQSRLVRRRRGRYTLENGPFDEATFARLPERNWTLLVQGINHVLPSAERLLLRFRFLPYARLDDLMVSYAPPGGGVGPHVDSYDVFLLQGKGRKRWEISSQEDRTLVPGAPLKILQDFRAEDRWDLNPGDLLYLPPRYAHHGIALDECMTYSIGFRALSAEELVHQFLAWLPQQLTPKGMYEDPELRPVKHPAEIDPGMVDKAVALLSQARWDRELVGRFLGHYLSDPKPHLRFEPPRKPLGLPAFARRANKHGVRLALASLMLSRGGVFYLNGEEILAEPRERKWMQRLADDRRLAPPVGEAAGRLHSWYRAGWIKIEGET